MHKQLAAFVGAALLVPLSVIADSPSDPSAKLYDAYSKLCGEYPSDSEYSDVLGCIVIKDDPKGTLEDIVPLVTEACSRLRTQCAANNLLPSARNEFQHMSDALMCSKNPGVGCSQRNN